MLRASLWLPSVLSVFLLGSSALAAQQDEPSLNKVRLSGFGTLAYVMDDRDDMSAIRDISQRPEDGLATGNSWRLDSRLGLHLDYRIQPKAELVAQAVLRDQIVQDLDSITELAYLGLRPSSGVDLRLGRVGYDLFLMSDHRNLGYAYNWVRPPLEYYGGIPLFSVDGLDLAYNFRSDAADWRIKALYGATKPTVPIGPLDYPVDMPGLWSLALSREAGPWRLKLGVSGYRIDSDPATLLPLYAGLDQVAAAAGAAGFAGISAEAAELRKELTFKGSSKQFFSLGGAYDDGIWTGQSEVSFSTGNRYISGAHDQGYLVLGRRIQDWTPFVMAAFSRPRKPSWLAQADWTPIAQQGLQKSAIDVANKTTRFDQQTLSLGGRWDFHDQAALKLQWDHSWINKNGFFTWYALVDKDSQINMLTISLDFVF